MACNDSWFKGPRFNRSSCFREWSASRCLSCSKTATKYLSVDFFFASRHVNVNFRRLFLSIVAANQMFMVNTRMADGHRSWFCYPCCLLAFRLASPMLSETWARSFNSSTKVASSESIRCRREARSDITGLFTLFQGHGKWSLWNSANLVPDSYTHRDIDTWYINNKSLINNEEHLSRNASISIANSYNIRFKLSEIVQIIELLR